MNTRHDHASVSAETTERNRKTVSNAFDCWASGANNFFDLLADDAEWTITGSGKSAKTFHGRQAFLDQAYGPIAKRFATPMRPHVRGLYADGENVVIHWDGTAEMTDGQIYRNAYAWFFRMSNDKVVRASAFLDLRTYDAALDGGPLPPWPLA